MQIDRKTRRLLRLHNYAVLVLFLLGVALLAWLSTRYSGQWDWTAAGRNSLSPASVQVLQQLDAPVNVTAFARESGMLPARRTIGELLDRYRRHYPQLELRFVNPDTAPGLTRELGVEVDGELVIEYRGRTEHVRTHTEEAVTNALQRLLRGGERRLGFLTGHGERAPDGQANHDLGLWLEGLAAKGIQAGTVHLGETGAVPENVDVLVLASPQARLLPGEVELLRGWVRDGGSLLWLREPGEAAGLEPLAADLGVDVHPGVVVDPTTQLLGLGDPSFALITAYPPHPVTRGLQFMTVLPQACALRLETGTGWRGTPLLETVARSWAETGPIEGTIRHDAEAEIAGPLQVGVALSRSHGGEDETGGGSPQREQRIAVICDGDFLSNTYLKNQGNEELGSRLVNWLASDDAFIEIPAATAADTNLALSERAWAWLGLVFLLILPAGLLGSGLVVWWRRRRS